MVRGLSKMTHYKTIKYDYGPVEIKEKGSSFISFIYKIEGQRQLEDILRSLRKKYHDATHVCYAYRLKSDQQDYFRYNDDGEPSGTAGLPIFNELKFSDYFDVLIAVVRYFGGVKLGTGGLVRAYGKSAQEVINGTVPLIKYLKREFLIRIPFKITGQIMKMLKKYEIETVSREYTSAGMDLRVSIREKNLPEVKKYLNSISFGKVTLQ